MSLVFVDREAAYPNKYKIIPEDGSAEYYVVLERADEAVIPGTPLNAETFNALIDEYEKLHADNKTAIRDHAENKSNPHAITAEQIGAVANIRTVNGMSLNADVVLTAEDVGAAEAIHGHEVSAISGLTDYAIANGTSGVWSYWKFNSGLCVAMGKPTVAWSATTQLVSGQSRSTAALDLSGIFDAVMGGTCSNVHRYVNCFVIPSGSTSAELWATTAVQASTADKSNFTTTPMVVLFGKWK